MQLYQKYGIILGIKSFEKGLCKMIAPICWSFQRKSGLPIVEVTGQCTIQEMELIMIQDAIHMIENANSFRGLPFEGSFVNPQSSFTIAVSFSFLFPTETDIQKYLAYIQDK